MKSYQRVLLFLLVVLFLTALTAPWFAVLWDRFFDAFPQWEKYRFPFSRIFDRTYMGFGIILFFAYRPLLKIDSMKQMGLQSPRMGYPDFLWGAFFGLAAWIILALAMTSLDVFNPYIARSLSVSLERSFGALMSGIAVGVLEEIFFRGIILRGLLADWNRSLAFVCASLFYSAVHFIQPAKKIIVTELEPLAGVQHVIESFHLFADPVTLFPGFFGLFVIGLVLSFAYYRTGSLYLGIGIHAGLVFGRKTLTLYGNYNEDKMGLLFGDTEPRFVSGVATWILVFVMGCVIYWMTRERKNNSPGA
ncbi:MAG: CPBP family intramembrane metalloprotease [Deltaproteobacteria bacterium]|nr:CPBP family intramembrane metalloprotease [Deltaproteobacteria bacterium]